MELREYSTEILTQYMSAPRYTRKEVARYLRIPYYFARSLCTQWGIPSESKVSYEAMLDIYDARAWANDPGVKLQKNTDTCPSIVIDDALCINPFICGGEPCVPGTAVPVSMLWARHALGGETIRSLAKDYGLEPEYIEKPLMIRAGWMEKVK